MSSDTRPAAASFPKPQVIIYTDGACKGNPGPGGWGAWLRSGDHEKELFGGERSTTNNRMELTAPIEALASLKRSCKVTIYTDSEYVRKGMTEWIANWQRLDALRKLHEVDWRWVKGHAGDPGNERADALANKGVASL